MKLTVYFFLLPFNHDKHYRLDKYRKLAYTQSDEQRVRLILSNSPEELTEIYFAKFNKNAGVFIDWFKKEYPEKYLELFKK